MLRYVNISQLQQRKQIFRCKIDNVSTLTWFLLYIHICLTLVVFLIYMIDSNRRPVSNRRPLLKSAST